MATDAIRLFDAAPRYEAVANARGLSHSVLVGRRRGPGTSQAYDLNTVDALHAQWSDIGKTWRGPATDYLVGYAGRLVARRVGDILVLFSDLQRKMAVIP